MSKPHLKEIGLKATYPRIKILQIFENSKERHLSAEDIHEQLKDDELELGLATIYRVLTQFEQAGLLSRHFFEGGRAVFELNKGEHHDHLICTQCGKVVEFYDSEIEALQNQVAEKYGFALESHAHYLYAICGDCQKKQKSTVNAKKISKKDD